MKKGELAIVLHAHLPYVKSSEPGSLEEDWFFQALMECYLPLLKVLEKAVESKSQSPKLTIGLSPTLLSLLEEPSLKKRFPEWIELRLNLLKEVPKEQLVSAKYLSKRIENQLEKWKSFEGDLIKPFSKLQELGAIDLITCAATHGYLPLLRENPEAILGQLKTAVREHTRLFTQPPLGIWLPECAYYEGLDNLMIKAELRYAILDGHGLLHASPRPRYGIYAPICSKNGVAFFGRDSESTLPVWSAKDGYPGDPCYREFHRDLGWDLTNEKLKEIGLSEPRPLGLKLHKITNQQIPLNQKEIYDPDKAHVKTKDHARKYLQERKIQLKKLENTMDANPILIAPFDAELFGHWWFEGPNFLAELFKQADFEDVSFTHLKDILKQTPKIQLCCPCPSSWGQGGYHDYWLNESNSWIIPELSRASKSFINFCNLPTNNNRDHRILKQAGKELLLSQSSDWSFILRAGTTTKLARDRIHKHLERFWYLIEILQKKEDLNIDLIKIMEEEDNLFPSINLNDWARIND